MSHVSLRIACLSDGGGLSKMKVSFILLGQLSSDFHEILQAQFSSHLVFCPELDHLT